jgi:hypothetical protein
LNACMDCRAWWSSCGRSSRHKGRTSRYTPNSPLVQLLKAARLISSAMLTSHPRHPQT